MATEKTIEDPKIEKPEPTLDQEIAQMVGASDDRTEQALKDLDAWNSLPSDIPPEEVSETPTEEEAKPTPEATPPTDSPELIAARAENIRLKQEADVRQQESQTQATIADSHVKAQQYEHTLVAAGHTAEAAKTLAEAERGKYVAEQNLVLSENRANAQYKSSLAKELSVTSGVTVESLMSHSTEDGMRAAATAGAPQAKTDAKIAELEAIIKKGQVPSQEYSRAAGRTPAPTAEARLLDQYNAGVRNDATEAAAARYGA